MMKNISKIILIGFLLCLTFNYTISLQNGNKKRSLVKSYYGNDSRFCGKTLHQEKNINRRKKTPTNKDSVVKKNKESTHEFGNDIHRDLNTDKRSGDRQRFSEEDLRQYEQLVIMKKYPYLDIKELELKYSPYAEKSIRQSVNIVPGPYIGEDPSLSEPIDEVPCVEINNRGLSGFAIPVKYYKSTKASSQSNSNVKIPQNIEFKNIAKTPKNFGTHQEHTNQ